MQIIRQTQEAGDNSTLVQIGTLNVTNNSLTGEQFNELFWKVAQLNTDVAESVARDRIEAFAEALAPRLTRYDEALSQLADPAFQKTLHKAQMSAAISGSVARYELLSDLLVKRVEHHSDCETCLAVERAIETVDNLDSAHIVGLSLIYTVLNLKPMSLGVDKGLAILDGLYGDLLDVCAPPVGTRWLEHLELLSAVRIVRGGSVYFRKMTELLPQALPVYMTAGLPVNSPELARLRPLFKNGNISQKVFVAHPVLEGRVVIDTSGDNICYAAPNEYTDTALREAHAAMSKNVSDDPRVASRFFGKWNKFEHLRSVAAWWDNIQACFDITLLGKTIAEAFIRGMGHDFVKIKEK